MSEPNGQIRIRVQPEPTPEEMAVISAVVAGLSARQPGTNGEETGSTGGGRERWAMAGRREVLRPFDRDGDR